jgi:hypothetical protein
MRSNDIVFPGMYPTQLLATFENELPSDQGVTERDRTVFSS